MFLIFAKSNLSMLSFLISAVVSCLEKSPDNNVTVFASLRQLSHRRHCSISPLINF